MSYDLGKKKNCTESALKIENRWVYTLEHKKVRQNILRYFYVLSIFFEKLIVIKIAAIVGTS